MDNSNPVTNRIPTQVWVILILLNIGLIISVLNSEILKTQNKSVPDSPVTITATVTPSPTNSSTPIPQAETVQESTLSESSLLGKNLYFISANPSGTNQIYAFSPGILPLTQFFADNYEKMHPSVNLDNSKIVYTAKKNGYWDIYVYDLSNGNEIRVTDSPEYEGHPTWSPDGLYVAYESYKNGNLDIFIQSMEDLNQVPIQLTDASEADFDPVWSPSGREIAFVSTRAGEDDIWIAHLDKIDNRFTNISNSPATSDQYPTWSPDGAYILWSSDSNGYPILQKMSYSSAAQSIRPYSEGSFPLWVGDQIYYLQLEANSNYLTSKSAENNSIGLPSLLIPGQVNGFSVLKITDSNIKMISGLAGAIERVLAENDLPSGKINSSGKVSLQELDNVQAPYPYLLDLVSDSFGQLREKTANETGWDFLNTLERAFTPITDPANPGNEQDWCLTGRAFEFNPLTMYADLAVIVREERSGQIYWRVYLKTRYQDGSQGAPLTQLPWLLDTRYSDDPSTYETGGNRTGLPEGYWVDFTALALSMGWERQPALTNWKTYFSSAKFNQFVLKDGLDWFTAMNQVYPIEALQSPTPLLTATITPSITPTIRYYRSVTPTFAPTTTEIPTRRPTWTPSP